MMGMACAFVFAAQMVNFAIPATGSSGHLAGGIFLAVLLGAFPAFLSMAAVLMIQSLLFADGGLLALGANIFNMGVIPCLIVYPFVFKPLVEKKRTFGTIAIASIVASIVALQLGALGVVLQTQLSGITALPFMNFLLLMQPIHLAIGFAEGILTAAVLCLVYNIRMRNALITLTVFTLLSATVLSSLASSNPDGLEWAVQKAATTELPANGLIIEKAIAIQETLAIMPGYASMAAGLGGAVFTFLIGFTIALMLSSVKRRSVILT
jgi:cobalt/nickel transport system permease protein